MSFCFHKHLRRTVMSLIACQLSVSSFFHRVWTKSWFSSVCSFYCLICLCGISIFSVFAFCLNPISYVMWFGFVLDYLSILWKYEVSVPEIECLHFPVVALTFVMLFCNVILMVTGGQEVIAIVFVDLFECHKWCAFVNLASLNAGWLWLRGRAIVL